MDMFSMVGDFLAEEFQALELSKTAKINPQNCAGNLQLPSLPRSNIGLAGLENQGATCYLNSLLQSLFMTYQFRSVVYSLPLFEKNLESKTKFLGTSQKREIFEALQKLFIHLHAIDTKAASTQELTKSFHWVSNEEFQQHDVQELTRIFYEMIERALAQTLYENILPMLYKGSLITQIQCLQCMTISRKEDNFYDISLHVKGLKSIVDSLLMFFGVELMVESDKYYCSNCKIKVEAQKWTKIGQIPPIITFSLNRYEMNMKTFDRVKLNDKLEFPLELDLTPFIENNSESKLYELKAIIIHSGGAYGGHYHALIHDEKHVSNWSLKTPEKFEQSPKKIEKVVNLGIEKSQTENPLTRIKKEKKVKENELTEKQSIIDYDYDQCDFPINYKNLGFREGWFDFNDSNVTPIPIGRLIKQFGSTSESAYMLIYLKKDFELKNYPDPLKVPEEYTEFVKNSNNFFKEERIFYQNEKQMLEVVFQDISLFNITNGHFLNYKEQKNSETQGLRIKAKFSDSINFLFNNAISSLNIDYIPYNIEAFEITKTNNNYCHILRKLDKSVATIEIAGIKHLSTWILILNNADLALNMENNCGNNAFPILIKINVFDDEFEILVTGQTKLLGLKQKIESMTTISPKLQKLFLKSTGQIIYDDTKSLSELKLSSEVNIILEIINPEEEAKSNPNINLYENKISLIVTREDNPNSINKYYEDYYNTLDQVFIRIKQYENISNTQQCRLRHLLNKQILGDEYMPKKLCEIEEFKEGGVRLLIEFIEVAKENEISLKIKDYESNNITNLNVDLGMKICELKELVCKIFNTDSKGKVLCLSDWIGEASTFLKQEEKTIKESNIPTTTLLILKYKNKNVSDNYITLFIHETKTGMPDNQNYWRSISVKGSISLLELKENIITSGIVGDLPKSTDPETLRLRDIFKTGYFGLIFRDNSEKIGNYNLTNDSHVICQPLNYKENLLQKAMAIFLWTRQSMEKIYINKKEIFIYFESYPKYDILLKECKKSANLKYKDVTIAKYFPYKFSWEIIHPFSDISIPELNKNEKNKKTDSLSMSPYFFHEGDIIAIRDNSEEGAFNDDFMTIEDLKLHKQHIENLKNPSYKKKFEKQIHKEKQKEISLKILTDF